MSDSDSVAETTRLAFFEKTAVRAGTGIWCRERRLCALITSYYKEGMSVKSFGVSMLQSATPYSVNNTAIK